MITHLAYGDESSYNDGRFRAVAIVSGTVGSCAQAEASARDVLATAQVRELKWSAIKDAHRQALCEAVLTEFLGRLAVGKLRVDVITWDTHDSRHAVQGRDDIENLARMYWHLCHCTFRDRWPAGARWGVYPDEMRSIEWYEIESPLAYVGRSDYERGTTLPMGSLQAGERGFEVHEITPVHSHDAPLVQIADVFAGLAVYSRESFEKWCAWSSEQGGQLSLIASPQPVLSNRDRHRCPVVHLLNQHCKAERWTVALQSSRGFETKDWRKGPVNFWFYRPQHDDDRAPTKVPVRWTGPSF